MTRLALAALVGLAMLAGPAAHAAGETVDGGCFVAAANLDNLTSGVATGVIGDVSATRDGGGEPSDATVTCWIDVNSSEVAGTRFSYGGFGVQAGDDRVAFAATPSDVVALCQQVVSGAITIASQCAPVTDTTVPPPSIVRVVDDILDETDPPPIDPTICPVLVVVHGDYGPITIGPDGDVYVADPVGLGVSQLQDCPPYTPPTSDGPQPLQVFFAPPSP